jgi:hypothetical protein
MRGVTRPSRASVTGVPVEVNRWTVWVTVSSGNAARRTPIDPAT